jgi:hypothetical protein
MYNSHIDHFDKAVRMRKESIDAVIDIWIQHSLILVLNFGC